MLTRQARQDLSRHGTGTARDASDGAWTMQVVVAEARDPQDRARLRNAATALRLAELREGVWTRPANLPAGVLTDDEAVVGAQCRSFTSDPRRRPRPPRRGALGPRRVGGSGHRAAPPPRRRRRCAHRRRPRGAARGLRPLRGDAPPLPGRPAPPRPAAAHSLAGRRAAGRIRRVRQRLQGRVAGLVPRPACRQSAGVRGRPGRSLPGCRTGHLRTSPHPTRPHRCAASGTTRDGHRRTVVGAVIFTVLNKLCDVMPELLIGAAVDVVVRGDQSLVGDRPRHRGPGRAADRSGDHQRDRVARRVEHRVRRPGPVAEPGPDDRARGPHGRLQPRAGPRARLVRGPVHRRPAVDPQRRREPARALPRRRRHRPAAHLRQRGVRRRRVLRRIAHARADRVRADPGHRVRVDPLPAPARAPLRRGAGPGRRPRRAPRQQPLGHRHHPGVPGRAPRGRPGGGRPARPTARPTATPSGCRRPSCR